MRWIGSVLIIIIIAMALMPAGLVLADSYTLYEYYNTNDDADNEIYLANYFAQTFTVGSDSHTINAVNLMLYSEGTPGNLYVSIRETTAGVPSGLDLSTGALTGNQLLAASPGDWRKIDMTAYTLKAGETYAIVCYGTGASNANCIHWRQDASGPTYAGGSKYASTNGGVTWAATAGTDFMFEVYGEGATSVDDVRVFTGYDEDDDWIIVTRYTCNDPLYAPYGDPTETWAIQLLNAAGDVVASDPLMAWGTMPGSIYVSAADATALEWGNEDYDLRIQSLGDAATSASFDMVASAWYGSIEAAGDLLDNWCIYTAKIAGEANEGDDEAYIINVVDYGDVLNVAGGNIFQLGVEYLEDVRPYIFYVTINDIGEWEETHGTGVYETTLDDWETAVGVELEAAFTDTGALVGLSGRYVGGMIVFISFLVLSGLAVSTGHFTAGLSLGSVVLICGVLVGLIPMGAMFVAIALLVVLFVKNFWWQGA